MNVVEACKLLNINPGATQEEVNTAFKKLAIQYHPDVASGSEDLFKQINEAKQFLVKNGTSYPTATFNNYVTFEDLDRLDINDLKQNEHLIKPLIFIG
jgi:preprotein translocase subunit Sec63